MLRSSGNCFPTTDRSPPFPPSRSGCTGGATGILPDSRPRQDRELTENATRIDSIVWDVLARRVERRAGEHTPGMSSKTERTSARCLPRPGRGISCPAPGLAGIWGDTSSRSSGRLSKEPGPTGVPVGPGGKGGRLSGEKPLRRSRMRVSARSRLLRHGPCEVPFACGQGRGLVPETLVSPALRI